MKYFFILIITLPIFCQACNESSPVKKVEKIIEKELVQVIEKDSTINLKPAPIKQKRVVEVKEPISKKGVISAPKSRENIVIEKLGEADTDIEEEDLDAKQNRCVQILKEVRKKYGYTESFILPEVIMIAGKTSNGASYTGIENVIEVDEDLYNLCLSYGEEDGETVLSFILLHELGHHFQHLRNPDFFKNVSTGFMSRHACDNSTGQLEGDADYFAVLSLLMSGQELKETLLSDFFAKLYEEYGLSYDLEGYPDLSERQQSNGAVFTQLTYLSRLIEKIDLLTAARKYDEVDLIYEYLISIFAGKDFLNNRAVNKILQTIDELNRKEDKYVYWLEWDYETRLKRPEDIGKSTTAQYLADAERDLLEVLKIDPDYLSAQLNLMTLYVIRNNEADFVKVKKTYQDLVINPYATISDEDIDKTALNYEIAWLKNHQERTSFFEIKSSNIYLKNIALQNGFMDNPIGEAKVADNSLKDILHQYSASIDIEKEFVMQNIWNFGKEMSFGYMETPTAIYSKFQHISSRGHSETKNIELKITEIPVSKKLEKELQKITSFSWEKRNYYFPEIECGISLNENGDFVKLFRVE